MNLTYEVKESGYTIFKDGRPWVIQDDYIPYPGATLEESVKNHINQIINEDNKQKEDNQSNLEIEIDQLKEDYAALLMEIAMIKAGGIL